MNQTKRVRTVAVIPCLNEANFIGDIVTKTLKHLDAVIVVDDGSVDDTAKVAIEAGAHVVSHSSRRGTGAATRSGFASALSSGAEIIVTLDGDGQHNPDEIPSLLLPLQDNHAADLVIGSRFLQPNHNMPPYRKFGIDIITLLYNFGSRIQITDSQSGFRAHSRRLLESIVITSNDFSFSIEILVKARCMGFGICETPVSCFYHAESSSQDPFSHGIKVAFSVMALRFRYEFPHKS